MVDFDLIRQAAAGQRGEDQKQLVTTGLEIVAMLLKKNADYGSSAWKKPRLAPKMTAREGLQCRMSDKLERLENLLSGKEAEVEESIEDSMRDLCGYLVLWLGIPDNRL
jgi:hypothetical protein